MAIFLTDCYENLGGVGIIAYEIFSPLLCNRDFF